MTFRSLTLSALLMLSLTGSLLAGVSCGSIAGRYVCYSADRGYIERLIREKAREVGVDPDLALEVARQESDLNPLAVSKKGAIGVMQLLPSTARALGVDPWDLEENIEGGLRYLKLLLDKYGDLELALAAYNAGPGAVDRYGGVPPYGETKRYVRRITERYGSRPVSSSVGGIRKVVLPDGTILITNLPLELAR